MDMSGGCRCFYLGARISECVCFPVRMRIGWLSFSLHKSV